MSKTRVYWRCKKPHRPFIAPCRDPLHLWALHWFDAQSGRCWFRYYADRDEAMRALREFDPKSADCLS